ncbi:MAG: DNA polymerase III subunit beta [Candidatus Binatia bacterium]|nr:MAG: DNA polymerase III subunit beta [Candidatus Binatia bacterium]
MEFTVERENLLGALYLAQGVVERRTPIPVLSHVMLIADGQSVTIAATDQQVGIRRRIEAGVRKKGRATGNGRMLYEIVRELPEGEVTVKATENRWLEIVGGKARFKVVGVDPEEFPAMPEMPRSKKGVERLGAEVLREMIVRTQFAVASDETRINLAGIYVEKLGEASLRMVATDGHRLAMVTREVGSCAGPWGVILPRKGVGELRRLLEAGPEGLEVSLVHDGGLVHVGAGDVELSMRLVEGEFPDYKQVLPKKLPRRVVVSARDLAGALRRVSLVSSDVSHGVRLSFADSTLKVSSMNPERGEAEEEVEVSLEGEPVSVGFNARYLLDVLGVVAPDASITLWLGDELSPAKLEADDDPDFAYVVMPMRL